MKCVICKNGETQAGEATVTLERNRTILVVRNVPAQVCRNCREYYLDAEVTRRVLAQAEDAARRGAELEVVPYAA